MESKQKLDWILLEYHFMLLIEPVWNRNELEDEILKVHNLLIEPESKPGGETPPLRKGGYTLLYNRTRLESKRVGIFTIYY